MGFIGTSSIQGKRGLGSVNITCTEKMQLLHMELERGESDIIVATCCTVESKNSFTNKQHS